MKKLLLALLLLASPALAQSVQQSGVITSRHIPYWVTSGVIGDGGSSADSPISSIGVTNSGGAGICVSSDRQTAAGRNQLCFGASTAAAATISLQNYGTATAQNLCFVINGTQTCIPSAGGTIPTITLPLVNGEPICASGTTGALAGCTGTTNTIPYWSSATAQALIGPAASSVLVTSAGNVPSLSQTLPTAVQGNITTVGTITSGVWSGTPVIVAGGGTGAGTLAAHGVLIGEGTSPIASVTTASIGLCLLSNGSGSDPAWGGCASGSGSAAGANTQVQYNNASALAGNANFTWVSPALTLGQNAATTGQLVLANGGATGVGITVQNNVATVAYNFNLPNAAGTAGQPLLSGGGGASAMTFGTLAVAAGGTNCTVATGTCLDNITGFSSTGFVNRTGAGTYSFTAQIGLANGGTGANLTASNGGLVYSTASALAILSGTATANQIPLSGSSTAPAWSTATYPATTVANQLLYSSATNTIGGLATGNNGVLITSGGGVPSISSTIPNATQLNITALGTIATGVWNGTAIPLANGGTNANLTASNGGIFYSTASAGAILSGTATAGLPLLSGLSTAPTWATVSYPASATSGGIAYFSSTSAMASSGLMTANALILGGGAGAAPTSLPCSTTTTVLHGGTPPTCGQIVNGDITANTITNASLATAGAATFKGNPTSGTATVTDFTVQGLTDITTPNTTLDFIPIYDHTAGTIKKTTASELVAAVGGGVTSITPGNGLTSTLTATAPGSAITTTGTLSSAHPVNAQTGTSYAIVDGDRAKLITASNAAAQAYTIAQAGAASAFQAGWYVDIRNVSTNAAGIVTLTPATSTINGAATFKVYQNQSVRITSDGTNYQTSNNSILPSTQTFLSGSGTYNTPAGVLWIKLTAVGAGGGGQGSGTGSPGNGTAGGNTCWNTSGAACTSPVYQAGGGASNGGAAGIVSGSGTPNIFSISGGVGNGGVVGATGLSTPGGGAGGATIYGGAGAGVYGGAGGAAAANTGAGGGGGGITAGVTDLSGTGGSSGAAFGTIITNPAGTYTYAIGAGGTGGAAGTNGTVGGAGAAGQIIVEEHYGI